MSTPGTHQDDTALRYVREEMAGLRASVDTLAAELRTAIGAWAPRIAVLERRADDHSSDLGELRSTTTRLAELERKTTGYERDIATLTERIATAARNRSTLVITLTVGMIIAVLSAVLAWALPR